MVRHSISSILKYIKKFNIEDLVLYKVSRKRKWRRENEKQSKPF